MAVEIGSSRLLTPYFSSSQIVWTIIIGTILIAVALGNIYGGKKADSENNPSRTFARIIVASVWFALIPVVGKYIITFITKIFVDTIENDILIIATLISCLVLFVLPLFLLGSVTPALVKFSVNDLKKNGTVVGRLYAFNTIGCIIGTFLPTFLGIPLVGTSVTFLIFSGLLLVISCIYFAFEILYVKPKNFVVTAGICLSFLIFVFCCIFGSSGSYANKTNGVVYEGESVYNYILVREDNTQVSLTTNLFYGIQSFHNKKDILSHGYYDYDLASIYMSNINNKDNLDVLILGNATGTFASLCNRFFNDRVRIDAVEIDNKITELGYELFDMPDSINIFTYDGRAYINATEKKYDVIMVDAYQGLTFPFQMSTVEFFNNVNKNLKDDGVMVVNLVSEDKSENSWLQCMFDTVSTSFEDVYCMNIGNGSNVEIFASNNPNLQSIFTENISCIKNKNLHKIMKEIQDKAFQLSFKNKVLTDDCAPVELIGLQSINNDIKYLIKSAL